jgi:hypothetical protein
VASGDAPYSLFLPSRLWRMQRRFMALARVIHDSQAIRPELYAGDDKMDGPGESGPESGCFGSRRRLSPKCPEQSRVSPGLPVG